MRLYIVRHGETAWNRIRRLQGHSDIPLNENGIKLAEETGKGLSDVPFDLCIAGPLIRTRQTALCVLRENHAFLEKRDQAGKTEITDFLSIEALQKEVQRSRREISGETNAKQLPKQQEAGLDQTTLEDWTRKACFFGFPLLTDPRIIEVDFGPWDGLGCGLNNMEVPEESFRNFFKDPKLVNWPKGTERVESVKARTADFLQWLCKEPAFSDKNILIASHGFAIRAMLNPFYENPEDFWQGHPPYNCAVNVLETDGAGRLQLTVRDRLFYDECLAPSYTDVRTRAGS